MERQREGRKAANRASTFERWNAHVELVRAEASAIVVDILARQPSEEQC